MLQASMPGNARADVLASNLSEVASGFIAPLGTSAEEFTTGSQAVTLQSVTIDAVGQDTPETFASLYTDAGGVPGNDLADTPSSILAIGDDTFTFSSAELLAANTSYWIVLTGGPPTTAGEWDLTADSTVTSASGIIYDGTDTALGMGFSPDLGLSNVTLYAKLALNSPVVATPEPESLALLGTGAFTLWLGRRRRRGGD